MKKIVTILLLATFAISADAHEGRPGDRNDRRDEIRIDRERRQPRRQRTITIKEYTVYASGETMKLRRAIMREIRDQGLRIDLQDYKLKGAYVTATRVGRDRPHPRPRDDDRRRPPLPRQVVKASLLIGNQGDCRREGMEFFQHSTTQYLENLNDRRDSEGRWQIEVCGRGQLHIEEVVVELLRKRGTGRPDRDPVIYAQWNRQWETLRVDKTVGLIRFESPRSNTARIKLHSVVAYFDNGRSREIRDLSDQDIQPGRLAQKVFNRGPRYIERIEVLSESWSRSGEPLRVILE